MELSDFSRSIRIAVTDQSQISEVRRFSKKIASELSFDSVQTEQVAIVATEVASNLVKHAKTGEVLLRRLRDQSKMGLEILSLDSGPGIADISDSMEDGHSTAGSPGNGMGAIKRMSGNFDIVSSLNVGTAIISKIWRDTEIDNPKPSRFAVGGICVAVEGETECGDNWSVRQTEERCVVMVADGLGHGPLAAEASDEAVRIFNACSQETPGEILSMMHLALQKTRGAAVGIAEIDRTKSTVTFAGVGNIAAAIISSGKFRNLVSQNGTVGLSFQKSKEYMYPWSSDSALVLNSDGILTNWQLDDFPGILLHEPSLISGVLFKKFFRGRDDATVVTVRET